MRRQMRQLMGVVQIKRKDLLFCFCKITMQQKKKSKKGFTKADRAIGIERFYERGCIN